jgi:maltose alpha-D-glucosyltransferase / alpha-amylase
MLSKFLSLFYSLMIVQGLLCVSGTLHAQIDSSGPGWLKTAVFYQIYPQSFKDSDGDGIGDLNGITQKLDYLADLGINAIWLNPIFASPFRDAGYDVTDYYALAPRYGTINDLKSLLTKAHKLNIRVVLDLVAGHTSDQHQWFKSSQNHRKNAFTDRYIWTNTNKLKPENFVSGDFGRNGNYLRNFFDFQPALNYGFACLGAAGYRKCAATNACRVAPYYWLLDENGS